MRGLNTGKNSFDAERRLAHTIRKGTVTAVKSKNSFDAERRLAHESETVDDESETGKNSFDAERRLAPGILEIHNLDYVVKIPSMPKGV